MVAPVRSSHTKAIAAFIIVYIVWGSTYFFIRRALVGFPPLLLGAIRFMIAGLLMMGWCAWRKEKLFDPYAMKIAAVSGFFILFVGNGTVIFVEQYVTSAWVAIVISAAPLWFVLLDKRKWSENLNSKATVIGLLVGFAGVLLLFSEDIFSSSTRVSSRQSVILLVLLITSMSWVVGSLYAKYQDPQPVSIVTTTWQMVFSGLYFLVIALIRKEPAHFHFSAVPTDAWLSLWYLVFFGSILAYSCYVWLINNRPASQVSTYAYVNPVVAVLLGVFFAAEHISWIQAGGLAIILVSVLLVNLSKYRKPAGI